MHYGSDGTWKDIDNRLNETTASYTVAAHAGVPTGMLVSEEQGDVERVISADGTVLASYTYDAWGNVLTSEGTLAAANPIRYRGYYFDTETSLYYLQSRYYDPAVGRFINADGYTSTDANGLLSANMFAYCENNPISRFDPEGTDWQDAVIFGLVVAAVGLLILATLPFSGPALGMAGAAVVSVSAVSVIGTGVTAAGMAVAAGGLVVAAVEHNQSNSANRNQHTSANQMQEQVQRQKAPKEVSRVDKGNPRIPNNKDHVHFKNGSALNYDGTPSHESRGILSITNAIAKWLSENGWNLPE